MLNLNKNVTELLGTHPVGGIEHVCILSQIFIKSDKFTKLLMTLIDRVYPIHLIIILVPSIEKECCCLSSIHNDNFLKI